MPMNKTITLKYSFVLIFCFFLYPSLLLSQKTITEKEIKRTGNYYFGDAYDTDTLKAKLSARDNLMADISKKMPNNNSLKGKSEILVNAIQYLIKPLYDSSFKVIAFVPVDNVSKIMQGKEELAVAEIKYTEAQSSINEPEILDKEKSIQVETNVSNSNDADVKDEIVLQESTTLLEQLVACNTGDELHGLLVKGKSNNCLIYSASEAFRKINSSENFYIVIIDPNTNIIASFFDKGKTERKDLKNGSKLMGLKNDTKDMTQVWIQLF
jgi:hypothetical protein